MVPSPPMEGNEALIHLAEKPGHQYSSRFLYFADVDVSFNVWAFY